MAQWTKRRAAGAVRNVMISITIGVLILALYVTGILEYWFSEISWGIEMFFQLEFYSYLFVMILIVGLIMFLIRTSINWGGA